MEEKLVVFELAGATYGVNVVQVQSIIPRQEIVTVPGASSFVEGVVNLRGIGKVGKERVIILLDPARIFSRDEQQKLAAAQGE